MARDGMTLPGLTQAQGRFATIPNASLPRSVFDRSSGLKTTFDAGFLVPLYIDEILPGDTVALKMSHFARMSTLATPFLDNLWIDFHAFFVPWRIVWGNWVKMNGEQTDPSDSTDFVTPKMTSPDDGYAIGSLSDYFGLPTVGQVEIGRTVTHMSLYHRAYAMIYDEWFRDENLQDSVAPPLMVSSDGPDDPAAFTLQRRGKRKDYFTGALPFPQKGPAVTINLGTSAPIIPEVGGSQVPTFSYNFGGLNEALLVDMGANIHTNVPWAGGGAQETLNWVDPQLQADLSQATASTINELREAFQLQKLYERDARGGTRYVESLRSHWGVTSPDQRLQRPQFLASASHLIHKNVVPNQTAPIGPTVPPQGALAAFGESGAGNTIRFNNSFTEHGCIMIIASVRADLTYQQGLDRKMTRSTRFDFAIPALMHLGEQPILNQEIYATGDPAMDDLVFGYQERYAEYRYSPSKITGLMRSAAPTSLDIWHLSQDFGTLPVLNGDFIEEHPPVDRVLAVPEEPHILFDGRFSVKHARVMPTYGVPGNIDRF